MNWDAIGAMGGILGAVAVFATLVYLEIQLKQNIRSMDESRKLAITQSQQDWTAMFNQAMLAMAESIEVQRTLLDIGTGEVSSLKESDKTRLRFHMIAMAARLDMMHLQYQNGFLPEETCNFTFVNSIKAFGPLMVDLNAGLDLRRPSFVKELHRILKPITAITPNEYLKWRALQSPRLHFTRIARGKRACLTGPHLSWC